MFTISYCHHIVCCPGAHSGRINLLCRVSGSLTRLRKLQGPLLPCAPGVNTSCALVHQELRIMLNGRYEHRRGPAALMESNSPLDGDVCACRDSFTISSNQATRQNPASRLFPEWRVSFIFQEGVLI
jgi:hypothetical protein